MKPRTVIYKVPDYYSEELQLAILKSTEDTIGEYLTKLPTIDRIIVAVCSYFVITMPEIFKPDRKDELVYKRQMLFYFLYHYSGLTASHIGALSKPIFSEETVRHSCKVITEMQYQPRVVEDLINIRKLIIVEDAK